MPSGKTLVIGLGNPILGDDGVGWVIANEIKALLGMFEQDIDVDCLALGGLSLMERMIGYQRVILIDSLNTGKHPQGSVVTFTLEDLVDLTYGHTFAAHDVSIKTALVLGRKLGASLPSDIDVHVVAIEAQHVYDFKEELSPIIAAAKPAAIQLVLGLIRGQNDLIA
jgi:hydrogenase maturation protease